MHLMARARPGTRFPIRAVTLPAARAETAGRVGLWPTIQTITPVMSAGEKDLCVPRHGSGNGPTLGQGRTLRRFAHNPGNNRSVISFITSRCGCGTS